MEPPIAGKFRSICMKNYKDEFSLLSKPMPFKFNRLTLLANIFSLEITEISEYQPSSSCRASKSRFLPYIHCKFCLVFPTTKMTSATAKPCIIPTSSSPLTSQRTPAFEVERALPWRGSDEQTWKAPRCTGSESPRRTVRARCRTRGMCRAPGPHQKAPYRCCRPIPYQRTASRFRGTVWVSNSFDARHCQSKANLPRFLAY